MRYEVPGVPLVTQQKNMACWYASAQMLIQWKRSTTQQTRRGQPDPSQHAVTVSWEVANNGVVNPQIVQLAKVLGLETVPPMTPSPSYLLSLLTTYGPLWTNGQRHIVVIGGIDEEGQQLKVYDPWPDSTTGVGTVTWRPFSWYVGNESSSRDAASDVQAILLYNPL